MFMEWPWSGWARQSGSLSPAFNCGQLEVLRVPRALQAGRVQCRRLNAESAEKIRRDRREVQRLVLFEQATGNLHTLSSTTVAPPPPSFCGGSATEAT